MIRVQRDKVFKESAGYAGVTKATLLTKLSKEWSTKHNSQQSNKGNPKPPSRQLLATWVVKAWEKIPEQLVRKAWIACGYQTEEQLCSKTLGQMVVWDENAIMKNLAEICGDDAVTHYRSEENDDEMGFFDFLGWRERRRG